MMQRETIWTAIWAVMIVCLAGVGLAAAQTADSEERISNGGLNHTLHATPVSGQPFSAEQVQKQGKTLIDGTNVSHFGHHFVARDSAGRVRVEQPCGCAEGHVQKVEVFVMDPVAGTLTTWRTGGDSPKVATVAKWVPDKPEQTVPQPVRGTNSSRPQPIITTAELPVEMLNQLPMKVTKTTTIVPAGRSGNDAPITKTHETWTSEELKLTFMEQWEDPRSGVRTVGLANFSRAEPDAKLFRVPAGFQVREGKDAVKEFAEKLEQAASSM